VPEWRGVTVVPNKPDGNVELYFIHSIPPRYHETTWKKIEMRPSAFFAVLLTLTPVFASADDFYIEDDSMTELPMQVAKAIQNAEGEKLKDARQPENGFCKLIGKPIDLGRGKKPGYFVTTADACNWGAALGPIWLVVNESQPVVVLSSSGAALVLKKQVQHGLPNVVISAGTAGWTQKSWWKYDGARYIKAKEEICTAEDDGTFKCKPAKEGHRRKD
jgi:hypothetical protein